MVNAELLVTSAVRFRIPRRVRANVIVNIRERDVELLGEERWEHAGDVDRARAGRGSNGPQSRDGPRPSIKPKDQE